MNNKNYLIFFLFLVPGCIKQKQKQSAQFLHYKKVNIDGVECKFCAKLAVERIEAIGTVERADFICEENDWENGFARIFSTTPITNEQINSQLEKEGFKIKGL